MSAAELSATYPHIGLQQDRECDFLRDMTLHAIGFRHGIVHTPPAMGGHEFPPKDARVWGKRVHTQMG